MLWSLLFWIIGASVQAGLLGVVMYQVIQLSDLAADYINPHDCCRRVNRWVVPEYTAQLALLIFFILTGRWLCAAGHLALATINARRILLKEHMLLATDVFRRLKSEQRVSMVKMGGHVLLFGYVVYRGCNMVGVLQTWSGYKHLKRVGLTATSSS